MARPRRRELELNELGWWSRWARLAWLDGSTHMLSSTSFREPFFNRAGLLECRGIRGSISNVEERFRKLGRSPLILVYASCEAGIASLSDLGYKTVDRMTVLELAKPRFRENDAVQISRAGPGDVGAWSKAYLLSFYGETALLSTVKRIVAELPTRATTLLIATLRGEVAGVLAVHRSPGLAGVYCLGTVPEFRKMGVAGTLITNASAIAAGEGRRLILQTLESDGSEALYLARGFRRLYVKNFMARES